MLYYLGGEMAPLVPRVRTLGSQQMALFEELWGRSYWGTGSPWVATGFKVFNPNPLPSSFYFLVHGRISK